MQSFVEPFRAMHGCSLGYALVLAATSVQSVLMCCSLKYFQGVYHCGYHSEKSYGASSYLIVRAEGNILIDRYCMLEKDHWNGNFGRTTLEEFNEKILVKLSMHYVASPFSLHSDCLVFSELLLLSCPVPVAPGIPRDLHVRLRCLAVHTQCF